MYFVVPRRIVLYLFPKDTQVFLERLCSLSFYSLAAFFLEHLLPLRFCHLSLALSRCCASFPASILACSAFINYVAFSASIFALSAASSSTSILACST